MKFEKYEIIFFWSSGGGGQPVGAAVPGRAFFCFRKNYFARSQLGILAHLSREGVL
jgi:hypothetical protein